MAVRAALAAASSVAADRDMVAVATAVVEVASVVDTGVAVVLIAAIVEITPRRYFVVAIAAADIVDMGLEVAASFVSLSTLHNTLLIQCVYLVQRSSII